MESMTFKAIIGTTTFGAYRILSRSCDDAYSGWKRSFDSYQDTSLNSAIGRPCGHTAECLNARDQTM
jgi:hypothetical protein